MKIDNNTIKTEKGLIRFFKNINPDKRLSKDVKDVLLSQTQKYKNINDKQFKKIKNLLIKAGKTASANKRITIKIEDLKQRSISINKKIKSPKKRSSLKKNTKSSKKRYSLKKKIKSPKKLSSLKKALTKKEEKNKECRKNKISTVMREFKDKKLKTRAGYIVTNPKQAIAIALSEASRFC